MPERYYVNNAIPYVNASPHVGFALETVETDAAARYWRTRYGADNVRAVLGTDENSLKNVRAAEKADEPIDQYVERLADEFRALGPLLNLSFDDFIRTREDRHIRGAQKLWLACDPDDIYKKMYRGLYCVGCEQFYTEAECPDGMCPEHKTKLELIEEENYFFRLSKYQKQIERLIESDEVRIYPQSRKNEALGFIRQGLEDFSISRSQERAQHWGVEVPNDPSQVMYVWFDALSNYISALGYADDAELFKKFWLENDRRANVIGKGILRFHAVYWVGMLLSAKLPPPTEIFVHGYVTIEGAKMSKSIGNVIHPKTLVDDYGVDAVRYFFLREMSYGADGDVSKVRLEERFAELANGLGNLVGRVAAMAVKSFEGAVGDAPFEHVDLDALLEESMREYNFKQYIEHVWTVVDSANHKIDVEAPFRLVKTDPAGAKKSLAELASMIRWIATSLAPIIPATSEEILKRYTGERLIHGEPLFPKREG